MDNEQLVSVGGGSVETAHRFANQDEQGTAVRESSNADTSCSCEVGQQECAAVGLLCVQWEL